MIKLLISLVITAIIVPFLFETGTIDKIKFFKHIGWRKRARKLFNQLTYNDESGAYVWRPIDYRKDDNWIWNVSKKYSQRVLDMPRLTFERWLTFYDNKPEAWIIQKNENKDYADIPYYVREIPDNTYKNGIRPIFLPIFWKTSRDMYKYRKWVEEKYQNGKASIYTNKQDENFKQLVTFIEEDIKAKRAQAEEELNKVRDTYQAQEKQIKLQLSNGPEVIVNPNAVRTSTPMK